MQTLARVVPVAVLVVIGIRIAWPYALLPQEMKEAKTIQSAHYAIQQALFAYAMGSGGPDRQFPAGRTSNEAMRQLFIAHLIDDERLFEFKGLGRPAHKPDGEKGSDADGYAAALSPGECVVSYNPGLNLDKSDPATPLVWYETQAPSGMHYLICAHVAGNVQIYRSKTGKFPDPTHDDGREVLSPQNGVDPLRVLHPEVPEQR